MNKQKIRRCEQCPYYSMTNVNYDLLQPLFSLAYVQKNYDLDGSNDSKVAFFNQMLKLSKISWKELNQAHRHGLGYEKINRTAIKAPIPSFIKPDVNFIAFRFKGKAAMVGYREQNVFYILWFDERFDLYNH